MFLLGHVRGSYYYYHHYYHNNNNNNNHHHPLYLLYAGYLHLYS